MAFNHSNRFGEFLKFIGIDYIVHHEEAGKIFDDTAGEACLAMGSNQTLLWMIQNPNSKWFFRQFASSMFHFGRTVISFSYSSTDIALSKIAHAFLPYNSAFTSLAAKQRFYKRMMLTFRLNGGAYAEFGQIIRNCVNAFPDHSFTKPYYSINNKYPVIRNRTQPNAVLKEFVDNDPLSDYSTQTLRELFKKQTGYNLYDIFSRVENDYKTCGPMIYHDAVLYSGDRVTITVIPKHVDRMRRLDLLPFKILRGIMTIIPCISTEKAIYDNVMRHLDFNLTKEVNARATILQKFDIDCTKETEPGYIFQRTRRLPLSISIPAPIKQFCGRNIMVTDRMPEPLSLRVSPMIAMKVVDFFADLLTKYNIAVPDISPQNILASRGNVALARYSTLTYVSSEDMHKIFNLFASVQGQDRAKAMKYAKQLGVSTKTVDKSVQLGVFDRKICKQLLPRYSHTLLAVGEGYANAVNLRNITGRASVMMPAIAGYAAKRASPNLNIGNFPYNFMAWSRFLHF